VNPIIRTSLLLLLFCLVTLVPIARATSTGEEDRAYSVEVLSTGSLYLCLTGLLHLGLPPSAPFWTEPATPWTQQRIWGGEDVPADHALHEVNPNHRKNQPSIK